MYNIKKHIWESDAKDSELLRWSREAANESRPEAQFLRGSELLSELKTKETTVEAVALMESSAKGGYPAAMYAMGQMCEYGWGVEKSQKMALVWYRRAADKGYKAAREYFAKRRRRRIVTALASCLAILLVAVAAYGLWWNLSGMADRLVIRVNENTELFEAANINEYLSEFGDLIAEYDNELAARGQVCTNRVIIRFEGKYLDLSAFPAERVIARGSNLMILQFSSEEDAQRCIEELLKLDEIVYAEMDETISGEESYPADHSTIVYPTSESPQNGVNSWGVLDMGLDQLSAYAGALYPNRNVTVAVIDGGIRRDWKSEDPDFSGRILPGIKIIGGGDPVPDDHGTHVAGTILDGTRGANVSVISLDVDGYYTWNQYKSTTILAVETAMDLDVQVISRSMGLGNCDDDNVRTGIEDAIVRAVNSGIVFVNSAGNGDEYGNPILTTFQITEPIVVGAYDINHNIASFCSYGAMVDVCAPGVNIASLDVNSNTMGLVYKDGTSMATPHISALAALLKIMRPDATPAEIEILIKDYCRTYVNPSAYATGLYGAGAPDATAFIEHYQK